MNRLKPSRPVLLFGSLWAVAVLFIAVRAITG